MATAVLAASAASTLYLTVSAGAKTPAEVHAETAPAVAGTPCTSAASACVDVNKKQAWLIKDGKVRRGPVPIATGGKGKDTPTGNVFRVYRKDKDFKSDEFKLKNGQPAPMPYSVFFEDGGIAFHSGNPKLASAGCVHLNPADAKAFFDFLQVGNRVQVMDGPVAAPAYVPPPAPAAENGDSDHGGDGDGDSDHDGGDDGDDGDD